MWITIPDFENYEINECGEVRNSTTLKLLKSQTNKKTGYQQIQLRNGKRKKGINIHRLVAELFVPNPNNLQTVNHIDGDKTNNNVENLEWCSYSDNEIHSYQVLRRTKSTKGAIRVKTKCYNKITGESFTCNSVAETSRKTGISCSQIRRILSKENVNATYEIVKL